MSTETTPERINAHHIIETAELVAGVPGWGILKETEGRYWVNLGRSLYGPHTHQSDAQADLDAES